MPIKNLRFSFDVPITALLGLIATGNAGLKIDVYGDDKPGKIPRLPKNGTKLLEGPKPGRVKNGAGRPSWLLMLEAMAKNPEHTETTVDLGAMLVSHGLAKNSVSPQMTMMKKNGFVTKIDQGVYRLTASGLREAAKRGYKVANASAPKKRKKKTNPAAAAAPAAVAAEADHG